MALRLSGLQNRYGARLYDCRISFGVAETACAGWRCAYPAYKTDMVQDCRVWFGGAETA
jgi:hypothetical protein